MIKEINRKMYIPTDVCVVLTVKVQQVKRYFIVRSKKLCGSSLHRPLLPHTYGQRNTI